MSTILRIPEQRDYDVIASWVNDAEACTRWAGPSLPFPFTAERLPELLSIVGARSYCLSDGHGVCIGFGQCWTVEEEAVHIGRIIVSPQARGRGTGRLLCEKLIAKAIESAGSTEVTLRVYRDNHAARSLYVSLGFCVDESQSNNSLLFMRANVGALNAMTIAFRPAQSSDVPELVSLMSQLGYETSEGQLQAVIDEIRYRAGEVFVAESQRRVVGCVNAIIDVRLAEGKVGEVASLVVDDAWRGRGLGRSLLHLAEEWLSRRVDNVRIRANAKRADAPGFYQSSGYERLKQQIVFMKIV